MRREWLRIGLAAWLCTFNLLAQDSGLPESAGSPDGPINPGASLEVEEDDFEDFGEIDDQFSDRELALSHQEIRKKFSYGAGLGVGYVAPWQKIGGQFFKLITPKFTHVFNLGSGDFDFNGTSKGKRYEMQLDTLSFYYGFRGFFWDVVPFFIQPMIGLATWKGDLEPSSIDALDDETVKSLTHDIDGTGLVAALNLGIMWTWEKGYYIEYSIFRLSRGVMVTHNLGKASSAAEDIIRERIENVNSWGYANIAIGKLF
jgi:hypothetical protein